MLNRSPLGFFQLNGYALYDISVTAGIASEQNTKLTATPAVPTETGVEVETAFPVVRHITHLLGLPSEADSSLPIVEILEVISQLNLAEETNSAIPFIINQTRFLGVAVEEDTAIRLYDKVLELGLAAEADAALGVETYISPTAVIGVAQETDSAFAAQGNTTAIIGVAAEADASFKAPYGIHLLLSVPVSYEEALPVTVYFPDWGKQVDIEASWQEATSATSNWS